MAHKAMKEIEQEREIVLQEMDNQRNMSTVLDKNRDELNMNIQSMEGHIQILQQHVRDHQTEISVLNN